MVRIAQIEAVDTHDLRRSLLRDGTASDQVVFDGDDDEDTFHLGAFEVSTLVAISTWMHRRYPDLPGHPGHQLRGMATTPSARGTGVSDLMLVTGSGRCGEVGSTLIWARARVAALSFYQRHGFETRGHQYVDLTTGLPHHDIVAFI